MGAPRMLARETPRLAPSCRIRQDLRPSRTWMLCAPVTRRPHPLLTRLLDRRKFGQFWCSESGSSRRGPPPERDALVGAGSEVGDLKPS